MHYLAKVTLENEMDLVLAHKRSMKLAEIAGLSLAAQTTFATAVSEVSRITIEHGRNGCLTLGISEERKRSIIACIKDDNIASPEYKKGLEYAQRLVDRLHVLSQTDENSIELYYSIGPHQTVDLKKLDEWRSIFRNEPPVSPYDEIKRKNEQLQQLAEKLGESEDHYRELTDTLPLMMFSLSETGELLYINKWMSAFFGRKLEAIGSLDCDSLLHDNERPSTLTIRELIKKGQPINTEWRLRDKNGQYIWHMVSIHPLMQDGSVVKWFGFLADINARKLFEQTLRDNEELKQTQTQLQANIKELNRSNEELQQFAYIASHDLQEPLRKIIFYSDYLKRTHSNGLDDKSATYLQNMTNASLRMRSLVSDLLAFSQVDRKLLNVKTVDLSDNLKQAIATFELAIKEKKAVISVAPMPAIEADEPMLQRLFENLLSNSLKYAREDLPPEITVECRDRGESIEISFTDNGIGFEREFAPRIFGIFQRLHQRDKYEGTGIGLAICRKIVQMHGGSIEADGRPGQGASFIIELPKTQS